MTMYCIILYMYVYIRIVIIKVHVLLVHLQRGFIHKLWRFEFI